ncbi:MAG TPA: hypothetical protein VJG83_02915 [archaeon]|nr:hypothetical protein [archaeon]
MELTDELDDYIIEKLYQELEHYRFNRKEWVLRKGNMFTYEGHSCSRCKIEDHSGIEIVNKKNPGDKFYGWFDWVHIKPCNPGDSFDRSKIFIYWEVIGGDKKLAEKYGIIIFSSPGSIPRWILDKFGVIYR